MNARARKRGADVHQQIGPIGDVNQLVEADARADARSAPVVYGDQR